MTRNIPDDVRRVQVDASNPAVSAFVAANAGSGKTHVLVQRVIRLLLDGVDPTKILCITFTKAAAANMANRVFTDLRLWTALDDPSLDAAIGRISNVTPTPRVRSLARQLFARALETPGGLKVQTIHAFCTQLLHRFPFEANVAARFAVLDEAAETQLLDQVSLGVFLEAARDPDGALGRALATAVATVSDQTFKTVVNEAIRKRDMVRRWTERAGGVAPAIAELCEALNLDTDDLIDRVEAEIIDSPLLPPSSWRQAAEIFASGSSNDQKQGQRFTAALAAKGVARVDVYLDVFLKGDQELRASFITKSLATRYPTFAQTLVDEGARLSKLIERRKSVACRDRTFALLTIAEKVIARYQAEKDRRGLLDYDDLIDKTLTMLGRVELAWVHYKLDRGIDHLLVDEAQDTSPRQWEIITLLVDEFFAGAGARTVKRTIFSVGDEKQSIFSFQGAAPHAFAQMRRQFEKAHAQSGLDFVTREFKYSFRSGPNVLGGVDAVFGREQAFRGLSADPVQTVHQPLPDAAPGLVEVWETIKPDEKREVTAWTAAFDALSETSPQVQLAHKIARNVKRWQAQGRPAGDVLVLVRQRGPLFEAIIRALKEADVPVAGADRLVLTEHIAVMDLMMLADALLLPDDDLALATVLKSPLFGLDDDDLFEIAWERRRSLRAALRTKADSKPRFAQAATRLDRLAEWARRERPFAFFARVLGPEGGRKRFLSRLGHEADDALQEFLNLALDYESRETPSLQGFIAWLRGARTDVKRDMEITRDEVRVMTVHGAKGLEAKIVILADTLTPPAGPPQRQPRLLALQDDGAPGAPERFVWAGVKATDVTLVAAARQRMQTEAEHEYRRLLYVAMTRAIDRLIVCGYEGERKPPDGCWYHLVSAALQPPVAIEELADDGDGKVWRYRKIAATLDEGGQDRACSLPDAIITPSIDAVPAWLERSAPAEGAPAAILSPSSAHDETVRVRAGDRGARSDRRKALARGDIMHRLLQSLPTVDRAARAAAAHRHLDRRAQDFSAPEREVMARQVCDLLDDPRFCELFAPGSCAEVPIVGRIVRADGTTAAVAGQIDRLVVTADAVLIADYKTNRPAPGRIEDVPPPYVTQLALYRAVLARLYPGKAVRAALVWTEVPDLMEVPANMLERALANLNAA